VAAACSESASEPDAAVTEHTVFDRSSVHPLGLASGTSFGMCLGHCMTELVVDSTTVWFIETSRDERTHPTRVRSIPLPLSEWTRLRGLVDPTVFTGLAGVHGCPDCADGGAEWIQIQSPAGPVRVTFEHGAVLSPIAGLQEEIRELRARFP